MSDTIYVEWAFRHGEQILSADGKVVDDRLTAWRRQQIDDYEIGYDKEGE